MPLPPSLLAMRSPAISAAELALAPASDEQVTAAVSRLCLIFPKIAADPPYQAELFDSLSVLPPDLLERAVSGIRDICPYGRPVPGEIRAIVAGELEERRAALWAARRAAFEALERDEGLRKEAALAADREAVAAGFARLNSALRLTAGEDAGDLRSAARLLGAVLPAPGYRERAPEQQGE